MPEEKNVIDRWIDNEHLGGYARTIAEWMTRDEAQAVFLKATEYRTHDRDTSVGLFAVHKVARQVEEAATCPLGNLAHWAFDGVRYVADYEPYTSLDRRERLTLGDVREALKAEMRDDDEGWWSDDRKVLVREWLAQTPYELWLKVNEVEEWTREVMREYLLEMARDEDRGGSVAREARERWERQLKGWLQKREAA